MKKKFLLQIIVTFFMVPITLGNVSLIMPNLNGLNGTQITVPVKVKDFINLIAIQGTIQFDQTIVTYVSTQDYGLPGMSGSDFGTTNVNNGILTFGWTDGTLQGPTLTDSSVIFSIKFNIIGTNGQTSPLSFIGTPTLLEASDSMYNSQTPITVNGSVHVGTTVGIDPELISGQLNYFISLQNYPNPFSGSTTIEFSLPEASEIRISVFDVTGNKVAEISGEFSEGKHSTVWNGDDIIGREAKAGIYFLRLQSGNYSAARKMIIW
jgi:hypothetical protein